jgi:hypothetical protein
MNYKIFILSKGELKTIILATILGGFLQVLSVKYLKNHPELSNNQNPEKVKPDTNIKSKNPLLRQYFPCGEALVSIAGYNIVINAITIITYIAKNGALTGAIIATGGIIVKKIPITAISTCVRGASPVNHSDMIKKQFLLVDENKISLNQCDSSLEYMLKILSDKSIPFKNKKEMSLKILMNYVDLKTPEGRIHFIF